MICFLSSNGKIIRIVILVNKVTWELQRNADVIIAIKSDHLFKKQNFSVSQPSSHCPHFLQSSRSWTCLHRSVPMGRCVGGERLVVWGCVLSYHWTLVLYRWLLALREPLLTQRWLDFEACPVFLKLRKTITILYLLYIYCFHMCFCVCCLLYNPVW